MWLYIIYMKTINNPLFKPVPKVKEHYHITGITEPRQTFTADIGYIGEDYHQDGYKYVLVILDIYSRYMWAYPLENLKADTVIDKLEFLFNKYNPRFFYVDRGREFVNNKLKAILKKYNIEMYHTYGQHKASMVERAIKTLKRYIYINAYNTNRLDWHKTLPIIVDFYNNKIHSTIKAKPIDVFLYGKEAKQLKNKIDNKPLKFNIGDKVRLAVVKNKLERKSYTPNWSEEIYTISKIKKKNPPMYIVKYKDKRKWVDVIGSFYEEELMKVE